jgi:hypothetical protein
VTRNKRERRCGSKKVCISAKGNRLQQKKEV